MNETGPEALFRLPASGPLISRERLERGEPQQIIREPAGRGRAMPGARRRYPGEKTVRGRYYGWRRQGIAGPVPRPRQGRGLSGLAPAIREAILAAKRENPRRSARQIQHLLESAGADPNPGNPGPAP